MTVTDFWSPLNGLAYTPEPEPVYCRSELLLLGDRPRLWCTLDADHRHDQVDARHGHGDARWTDEDAAEARTAWWAQFDGVCADCDSLIRLAAGNRCAGCSRRRFAADDIETEMEDAA